MKLNKKQQSILEQGTAIAKQFGYWSDEMFKFNNEVALVQVKTGQYFDFEKYSYIQSLLQKI
jgi:hypothetical protein